MFQTSGRRRVVVAPDSKQESLDRFPGQQNTNSRFFNTHYEQFKPGVKQRTLSYIILYNDVSLIKTCEETRTSNLSFHVNSRIENRV